MIVRYLSVEQDIGKGRKGQTVKIIDFEDLENNEFLVTNQFKVHGLYENIIPDIIVFINGLPIAVIECKAPATTDPMGEATRQLLRYSNRRTPASNEGAERLFWYNQIMVATCRENAFVASVSSQYEHYLSWKDPFPFKETDIADKPNPQQIERFKKPMEKDQLSILIVKDMLITGFDAPVEQVMYLDRKLMDHNLLQAIARVNRTAEGKSCGFIVDYYGLADYLNDALAVFSSADIKVIKSKRAQASEIEHAIKHHITIRLAEDPEYYASLSVRLKSIIDKLHDNWEQLVLALTDFKDSIEQRRGSEADSLGLSTTEFAFYNVLVKEAAPKNAVSEPTYSLQKEYSSIAAQIVALLEEATLIVDFYTKEHEQKRVRRDMKRILQDSSLADLIDDNRHIMDRLMDLGKVHFAGNSQ